MEKIVVHEDAFYTAQEVSEILSVSLRTVRRYISSGDLGVVRPGGRVLIPGHELLEFLYEDSDFDYEVVESTDNDIDYDDED